MPATWQLISGYLIGPGANLGGADLSGANLTDVDLADVISGAITGSPSALPDNWQLTGGYLIGPGANLSYADLTGASLTDAVLIGASFSYGTILFDGQTVLEHGFDAASLKNYLVESRYANDASNLTIIPEPTTLLLALLALAAVPLRVRHG